MVIFRLSCIYCLAGDYFFEDVTEHSSCQIGNSGKKGKQSLVLIGNLHVSTHLSIASLSAGLFGFSPDEKQNRA